VRAYMLTFVNMRLKQIGSMNQPLIEPLALLGIADLAVRWRYTRQGVHQFVNRVEFPASAATVNSGRVRVWHLADIEEFERGCPALSHKTSKRSK
jgi:hypothetical protein